MIKNIIELLAESVSIHSQKPFRLKVPSDQFSVLANFVIWQYEDDEFGIKNLEKDEYRDLCEHVVSLYKAKLAGKNIKDDEFEEVVKLHDRTGTGDDMRIWAVSCAYVVCNEEAQKRNWETVKERGRKWVKPELVDATPITKHHDIVAHSVVANWPSLPLIWKSKGYKGSFELIENKLVSLCE